MQNQVRIFGAERVKLACKRQAKISLIGAILPSDKDIFFRAKQKETLDRYQAARRFLCETENNPFKYLKSVCPEYTAVIDFVIEFWDSFSQSNVRINYNFLKHKGALCYEEIQKIEPCRFFRFK